MRIVLLAMALLVLQTVSAQPLTKEEKAILARIDAQMPETMKLLEEMVNINSGTLNVTGVRKVGDLLGKAFQQAGFQTTWVSLPDSLRRAGHLVATRKGSKGRKLFLIGHLDTVFEPDMPANPYRKLNDSTVTGQGVNDMKGGDVIMLAAVRALNDLGLLKDATITAYFTGDEEKAGLPISVSRSDFIERAKQHEVALGFEGATALDIVAVARRGSSSWTLTTTGKQSHSSGVFSEQVGYGANFEMARILESFRQSLSGVKYLTFHPGLVAGGTELKLATGDVHVFGKTNIVAPSAVAYGDLRYISGRQEDSARQVMRRLVATGNLSQTSATIKFEDGIPAMEPTAGNYALQEKLSALSMAMGYGPTHAGDPGKRGAGDISYVAAYVDCLDGLGASGMGAHAPGETMDLKEFPILLKRAALYIYRLTR
ncbi:MAG: M20/M25/M40 family metallo-hydrolase [Sphingobacteriales bacterium]|jgi:glutamate carboxypeptidase